RVDAEGEAAEVKVVQSEELWLDDGNLIVRTTSKDSPPTQTLYKVHKRVLALHCSAFASLFDGPQAAFDVGSAQHEGIPVMDLPDAAEDVQLFLKALYFPKETQRHSPVTSPVRDGCWNVFPASYHGILRLAAKYDAPDILDLFLAAMKADWPPVLKDWEYVQDQQKRYRRDSSMLNRSSIRLIPFARECRIPAVLPAAFYELACAMDTVPYTPADETAKRDALVKAMSHFSAPDLLALLAGRGLVRGYLASTLDGRVSAAQCGDRLPACTDALAEWWKTQESDGFYAGDPLDWLRRMGGALGEHKQDHAICGACKVSTRMFLLDTRRELWRKLPLFFGLVSALFVLRLLLT
ncbi:hypothetical protein BV25DRAFT_1833478, partial [Artomyces pyxidatus]